MTHDIRADLRNICAGVPEDKLFVLLDENTAKHCWPLVKGFRTIDDSHICVIPCGEENKNLSVLEIVWNFMGNLHADRKSILINIGGGLLTDLGGFAAGTFKRGIGFINIPTTLLAMVDASVGGKSGINFRGLKNEIGLIRQPRHVFLHLPFLQTLDDENFRSGFAEMLKAGLIADNELWGRLKSYDLRLRNEDALRPLVWESVLIKKKIVDLDPEEHAERKALNFGHTIGHALESLCLSRGIPLLHGYAVAHGMIREALLSQQFNQLSSSDLTDIQKTLTALYGSGPMMDMDADQLISLMRYDKKNEHNRINFTLLNRIGSFSVNHYIDETDIRQVLTT